MNIFPAIDLKEPKTLEKTKKTNKIQKPIFPENLGTEGLRPQSQKPSRKPKKIIKPKNNISRDNGRTEGGPQGFLEIFFLFYFFFFLGGFWFWVLRPSFPGFSGIFGFGFFLFFLFSSRVFGSLSSFIGKLFLLIF